VGPEFPAIENLIKYGFFLLVPLILLRRPKGRSRFSSIFASPQTHPAKTIVLSVACALVLVGFGLLVLYPYTVAAGAPERGSVTDLSLGGLTRGVMGVSPTVGIFWATALVILIATSEELLFRGVIYSGLRERIGVGGALLLESAMFSTYHYAWFGSVLMLHFFMAGASLTWLYERTRSIYPPVAVHGALLTISVLLGVLGR